MSNLMTLRSLTLLLTTLGLLFPFTRATCYWANSTLDPTSSYSIATDDTPCFPTQLNSPCCGTGWSCLSDGVCYIRQNSQDFYYRGTCTDRTWASQECPGWCFAQNSNTSIPLAKCKKSTGEDWYCCPGDADCSCDTGKDAVKLGASQPVTVTVIGSTSWPGMTSTVTSGAGNIASSGTTTVLDEAVSTTATGTANAVSASATSTASPTMLSTSSSKSSNTALAAGLGVGIGAVALILIAIAAFFLLRRSRRRRGALATGPKDPSAPGASGPGGIFQSQTQPLMAQRPGDGYYATDVINEKDGAKTWAMQELPSAYQGNHDSMVGGGMAVMNGRAEMDENSSSGVGSPTSYQHRQQQSQGSEGVYGRVELA